MKILIVSTNLDIGGVQTSLVAFANKLSEKNMVDLILLENNNPLRDGLNKNIKVRIISNYTEKYMNLIRKPFKLSNFIEKSKKTIIRLQRLLNLNFYNLHALKGLKIEEEYDLAISFTGAPGIWDDIIIDKTIAIKKVVWIHNSPQNLGLNKINYNKYYDRFDEIYTVSKDNLESFVGMYPLLASKSKLFYNLVDKNNLNIKSKEFDPDYSDNFNIAVVSRIYNKQKRIDRIVEATNIILDKGFNNFHWHIVGDGPDFEYISNLVEKFNLKDYITLYGFKLNPYPYISKSNILAITSDYEGLPMTIMESLALKTPVLVTKFGSHGELIIDGANGYVVEKSSRAIAEKIIQILENEEFYLGLVNGLEEYNLEDKYDRGFENLLKID